MANTAKAQAIFKGMTPEQQQAFLNKQKTASAGDQAKVSAALKPIKPVVSTPAATTPGAPMTTVQPSNTPPINTPPVEPVQDNTVGPADPVTPQIDKAKVAWAKMNADQQQEFASKHNFDPKKYGLEFAKGSTKPQQPIGQNNQTTPPAATTPEAPAPVVSTQPNYQDNSTARLQEIRNNLDQQLQAAPSLFDDRMAFDATFNYALRSKEQQAVLNNFWYQKSQSDLFNNTPTDVLANSIASNQTSIDAFSFMKDKDPVKYAALQAAVTEANKREALKASLDPATFMQEFNERHDAAVKKIDEQESIINTAELIPAITQGKAELAGLKSEIDQIELDKAKIKDEVLAEYEGKGISKGLLNEIVADRQQTLVDQGNAKILAYNSKLGGLNAKMDEMKMYNDLEKQRYDLAQQEFTNKASVFGLLKDAATGDAAKVTVNPITGETLQWNPETSRYDIPVGSQMETTLSSPYSNSSSNNSSSEGTGMTGAGARNNNPGNITDMTFGNPTGNDGKFAQFATPEEGFDALVAKIKYNQTNKNSKYYDNTLTEYFKRYAPSSDGNNPENYANTVAKVLGVTSNTKISDLDPIQFAAAIAKHDSGYDYNTYGKRNTSSTNFQPVQEKYLDDYDKSKKTAADEYNFLTKNKLSKEDYANWKNQETLAASDFNEAYQGLSPEAKSVVSGRSSLKSILGVKRNQIAAEIAASGADSFGMGDQDRYNLTGDDQIGVAQYLQVGDRIKAIEQLANKTQTGTAKEVNEWLKGQIESWAPGLGIKQDTDFNTLKTITGKILTEFIKNISGTAVSAQERQALIELIPTTSNSKTKFLDNLDQFKKEYENKLGGYLNAYGFMDEDVLRASAGNILKNRGTSTTNSSLSWDDYVNEYMTTTNGADDMVNQQ